MDDTEKELNEVFVPSSQDGLSKDVLTELQSILRLHAISPQEVFWKWESYSMKMGSEETKLDLQTVRAFKRDVQDTLERESRGKNNPLRSADKKGGVMATPRAANNDVFGMYVFSLTASPCRCSELVFIECADNLLGSRS